MSKVQISTLSPIFGQIYIKKFKNSADLFNFYNITNFQNIVNGEAGEVGNEQMFADCIRFNPPKPRPLPYCCYPKSKVLKISNKIIYNAKHFLGTQILKEKPQKGGREVSQFAICVAIR